MRQVLKEILVQDKDGSNEVVGPRRVITVGTFAKTWWVLSILMMGNWLA
jgi:hypothetical protein